MSPVARTAAAMAATMLPFVLHAQLPAVGSPPSDCGRGDSRMLRSVMGGTAGAIVGLVAVNIRYSSWSDQQPRNLSTIRLNASVVGGLLGASLGRVRASSCSAPRAPKSSPRGLYADITTEEIERSGITGSVYELVYSLRRPWLNTRGIEMSETPQVHTPADSRSGVTVIPGDPTIMVYLDNGRMGDMVALKTIAIAGITSVKYFDAAQATQKWGTGHNHGAIQVLTGAEGAR